MLSGRSARGLKAQLPKATARSCSLYLVLKKSVVMLVPIFVIGLLFLSSIVLSQPSELSKPSELSSSTMLDHSASITSSRTKEKKVPSLEEHESFHVSTREASIISVGEMVKDTMDSSLEKIKSRANSGKNQVDPPMLVHRGEMSVTLQQQELDSFAQTVERIVNDSGTGYIQERSFHDKGTRYQSLSMQIRVPSHQFFDVIHTIEKVLAENGNVESLSTSSSDVTDQYVDASARADVMEASLTSLQRLLTRANTVEEVLNIQSELKRLTESYESQRQRARSLKKQADLSTLYLTARTKATETTAKPEFWNPLNAASLALVHVSQLGASVIETVMYSSVWAALFTFIVIVVYSILSCLKSAGWIIDQDSAFKKSNILS